MPTANELYDAAFDLRDAGDKPGAVAKLEEPFASCVWHVVAAETRNAPRGQSRPKATRVMSSNGARPAVCS